MNTPFQSGLRGAQALAFTINQTEGARQQYAPIQEVRVYEAGVDDSVITADLPAPMGPAEIQFIGVDSPANIVAMTAHSNITSDGKTVFVNFNIIAQGFAQGIDGYQGAVDASPLPPQ